MRIPNLTDADFLVGLQALLPRGPVWPRDSDAVLTQSLAALVPTTTRQAARATNLLTDAFPATTLELLPEWEATLGLPDPCVGLSPTIKQRRDQVVGRLTARGGQSVPYFIAFALSLGYAITITQFTPAKFGMPFGQAFGGAAWAFAWQVDAPGFTIEDFKFGTSGFGEAFRSWDNTVLQCELQRFAPAHTTLFFIYQ